MDRPIVRLVRKFTQSDFFGDQLIDAPALLTSSKDNNKDGLSSHEVSLLIAYEVSPKEYLTPPFSRLKEKVPDNLIIGMIDWTRMGEAHESLFFRPDPDAGDPNKSRGIAHGLILTDPYPPYTNKRARRDFYFKLASAIHKYELEEWPILT